MIRIVTAKRLARLEADIRAAHDEVRENSKANSEAAAWHAQVLADHVAELNAAQEELRRRETEVQRLREELDAGPSEGDSLTVLLHYGEVHTVYGSRAEARADTPTHGLTTGDWVRGDERPPAEVQWRLEAFTYDPACNGFRRVYVPAQRRVGEAA